MNHIKENILWTARGSLGMDHSSWTNFSFSTLGIYPSFKEFPYRGAISFLEKIFIKSEGSVNLVKQLYESHQGNVKLNTGKFKTQEKSYTCVKIKDKE